MARRVRGHCFANRGRTAALVATMSAAVGLGCPRTSEPSRTAPRVDETPTVDPAGTNVDPLLSSPRGRWPTNRTALLLTVPDVPGWRQRPDSGRFLVLDHAQTSSVLIAQAWYTDARADRHRCEQLTRAVHDVMDAGGITQEEPVPVPEGFDTTVRVVVATSADGVTVEGSLLAFGASRKECFTWVFGTRASGRGAERLVADRLAVMRASALGRVRLERDTEPVPRAPHPALGPGRR